MKKIDLFRKGTISALCALLLVLGARQSSWAQQGAAAAPAAKADGNPKAETETEPQKPGGEGVKIHGHWVIDLKSPDGKLVDHREFENSLTTLQGPGSGITGDQLLTALLSGNAAPAPPGVAFIYAPHPINSDQSQQCGLGAAAPAINPCHILTVAGSPLITYKWTGASIASPGLHFEASFAQGSVNWVLFGNLTVSANEGYGLASVGTILPLCIAPGASFYPGSPGSSFTGIAGEDSGPTSAVNCSTLAQAGLVVNGMLTFANIPNGPMTVTAGQVISVTVTISFS
jgi:hypothetical protein